MLQTFFFCLRLQGLSQGMEYKDKSMLSCVRPDQMQEGRGFPEGRRLHAEPFCQELRPPVRFSESDLQGKL